MRVRARSVLPDRSSASSVAIYFILREREVEKLEIFPNCSRCVDLASRRHSAAVTRIRGRTPFEMQVRHRCAPAGLWKRAGKSGCSAPPGDPECRQNLIAVHQADGWLARLEAASASPAVCSLPGVTPANSVRPP